MIFFDIIDEGRSNGNVSQFYIYLCYPWTNLNKISTTMVESWPATKGHMTLRMKA